MNVPEVVSRKLLWRWLGWFAVMNALVLGVISLRYLGGYPGGETLLAWVYLLTIYISHHSWLALLPMLLLVSPLIVLLPRNRIVFGAGVLLMAALIALIMLDSLLWSQGRFHINLLTAKILGIRSWIFVGVMFLIGLFFESMLASGAWKWVSGSRRRHGATLGLFIGLCFVMAQGIYAWSDASYYTPVTGLAQQLPVHRGFTAKKFLVRNGLIDIRQSRERQLAVRLARGMDKPIAQSLVYPLKVLECSQAEPLNLLVIMLDAWRFDMLNAEATPNILQWAKLHSARFTQHFSGGNSSRMGIFSFFYGLPPGYFRSFEAVQRPALLVDELQRQNFQLGLFTSADMYRPVTLDRTAFASVPDLRITPQNPSAPAWRRDLDMLDEWFNWMDRHDQTRPFFGFLFFDASNARSFPPDYPGQFEAVPGKPKAEAFAAYQTSIHFDDSLVARVLTDLRDRGEEDRTVVLITSDHGEEFMESGPGFKIHGSGYSRYQLQVPMLLAWPGKGAQTVIQRTSHYDVAPTLLGRLLGCSNDAADFSSGADLFEHPGWEWLIAGSYYNYAVLEPDQVTVTFPNGLYEVRDWQYRVVDKPEFRGDVLQAVMRENRRFHR